MASPFSSKPSAFLALPVEVRRHIYGFCIPQKLRYDVGSTLCYRNCPNWFNETSDYHRRSLERDDLEETYGDNDNEIKRKLSINPDVKEATGPSVFNDHRYAIPELLLCCHQITEEVMDVLYGENTFQVNIQDEDEFTLADLLTSKTREKIRKMVLILRPRGLSYRSNYRMDPDFWDGIFGNLQVLGIIAEQPECHLEEQQLEAAETEDAFEEWAAWIAPIFRYMRRALNRKAKIMVDANDEQRTVELIEEAIPERCHFQRLPIADLIFKRGKFASPSGFWAGYWDHIDDGPITARDCIDDDDYDLYYSD